MSGININQALQQFHQKMKENRNESEQVLQSSIIHLLQQQTLY